MPIKKDGTGKRWVEMEVLLPGTPEQIWDVLATGPGYATWFVRGEIEPRVGGKFSLDFGGGVVTQGEVTAWEPHRKFSYVEREWAPGAPDVATEIIITARSGDQCLMRMVHSLYTSSDDWDDQVEGFEKGWPAFFEVLRAYLTHFEGMKAECFMTLLPTRMESLAAWQGLCDALGLAGANVGEQRSASTGPESWTGVVEHVHQDAQQRWVVFRTERPSPGIGLFGTQDDAGRTNVSICRYFYGQNGAGLKTAAEVRWQEWLGKTFTPDPLPASSAT